MGVINERMRFETFNDFYIRRKIIKELFDKSSDNMKEVYKYYVFANSILSRMKKECIWEYLSEPSEYRRVGDHKLRQYYNKGGDTSEHRGRDTEENTEYGRFDREG